MSRGLSANELVPTTVRRHARNVHLLDHVKVGDEIGLWSPQRKGYFYCRVTESHGNNVHRLERLDGDSRDIKLSGEQWRFLGASAQRVHEYMTRASGSRTSSTPLHHSSRCRCSIRLRSTPSVEPIISRSRRSRPQRRP